MQIKVYNDIEAALEKVREVEEKPLAGAIEGVKKETVQAIDFAVNSEIHSFDRVR